MCTWCTSCSGCCWWLQIGAFRCVSLRNCRNCHVNQFSGQSTFWIECFLLTSICHLTVGCGCCLKSKQIKIVYTQEEDDDTDLLRLNTTQFLDSCWASYEYKPTSYYWIMYKRRQHNCMYCYFYWVLLRGICLPATLRWWVLINIHIVHKLIIYSVLLFVITGKQRI